MARLSGLQKEVLALYRNCLRESRNKPQATRTHFESFARAEFARNLSIEKRDFAAIEFLLRKGRRQLEVYASPGIKDSLSIPIEYTRRPRFRHGAIRKTETSTACGGVSSTAFSYKASSRPKPTWAATNLTKQPRHETTKPSFTATPSDLEPRQQACSLNISASLPVLSQNAEGPSYIDSIATKDKMGSVSPVQDGNIAPCTPTKNLPDLDLNKQPYSCMEHDYKGLSKGFSGDAAFDTCSTSEPIEIDNQLVEAISRNIAQQLQMLSVKGGARLDPHNLKIPRPKSSGICDNESRSPSQRQALDSFTHELQRYAEKTNAKDPLPILTPTPPPSGTTLHTVSALLPYRSEFTAAGLAVTSKDQAKPHHLTVADRNRTTTKQSSHFYLDQPQTSQLDRNEGCQSSSTKISFPAPRAMDEWRLAMADQLPLQVQRTSAAEPVPKSQCVPCLRNDATRIPKVQGRALSERRKRELAEEKELHHLDNPTLQRTLSFSQAARTRQDETPSRSAFFSGPRLPTTTSGVRQRPMRPMEEERVKPSSGNHQFVLDQKAAGHLCRQVQPAHEQGSMAELARTSNDLGQQGLAQPCPRRYKSLPAQLLAPELSHMTDILKPLPDLPPPEVRLTPIWKACRLPIEAASIASTLPKAQSEDEKSRVLSAQLNGGRGSPVTPTHVTLCSRGFSSRRVARPNVPQRTSSIRNLRTTNWEYAKGEFMDRDVLRGLHIAASAACDEQIDAFIREKTGLHIRRFLADLTPFEKLGDNSVQEANNQQSRRRRSEIRMVKQRVRRSREIREAVVPLS
ncbi:hypothetical protein FZEAL_7880 [Fusarium zealandicum]|uniref:Complex 1 LYR protein domain-containing protein n=1 Tax=Fusarium zealandicum TaxID=1053134 RepID=A0A8H4UEW7_9HYPO|nr:hypothetical protein FZEAL_7880 [Fusarium zealandicum]